jgi:hypothetical protein
MEPCTQIFCKSCLALNEIIANKFEMMADEDFKKKTHLFNGRYENLYLDEKTIPELVTIINTAMEHASNILDIKKEKLAAGFWLNSMSPGDITTAHTHDDDDELLSGVYYIKVAENSGDLIITKDNKKTIIKPQEGNFIYFSPDTLHEVSKNKSAQSRLSIAFNFGLKLS